MDVCRDVACLMEGAPAYTQAIRDGLSGDADVEVHEVSCLGRCEHAPAACVNDVPLLGAKAETVVSCAAGAGARCRQDGADERAAAVAQRSLQQPRRTLRRAGGLARDAQRDARHGAADAEGRRAARHGRRRASPPVSSGSWCGDVEGEDKYAVVNADESEPGTFKDRVILEELPHLVVEGLLTACAVAGANKAIIFNPPRVHARSQGDPAARSRASARAACSNDSASTSRSSSPRVATSWVRRRRSSKRSKATAASRANKPPYPTNHGIHGKPTLMNNVETFHYVPLILKEGAEAWKARGANGATGLKFLSLCGDVERSGGLLRPDGHAPDRSGEPRRAAA